MEVSVHGASYAAGLPAAAAIHLDGAASPLHLRRGRRPGFRTAGGRATFTPEGALPSAGARRDVALLFCGRGVRLFAFGLLSVVLVLHLAAAGLSEARIGILLSATLAGDTAVSFLLTTRADRLGRRLTLLAGGGLVVLAGAAFAASRDFGVLLAGAAVGTLSPAGNEVGPFLAVEQAALAQSVPDGRRTPVLARYALTGSLATALGSLCGGALSAALQRGGASPLGSYRAVAGAYAALGGLLVVLYAVLSPAVEAGAAAATGGLGLRRSRPVVARLAGLFGLDAFAGALLLQSLVAWWFHRRFGVGEEWLGALFFGANLVAGLSALVAGWLASRIGLLNTMVFTHLPSNALLFLVPLMPTAPLAAGVLLARFSISQMDVPTRQSYVLAVVDPAERSAAAGITGIARTVGASLAPLAAGPLFAAGGLGGAPFFAAGALKIAYDLALWRGFRRLRPPEERGR